MRKMKGVGRLKMILKLLLVVGIVFGIVFALMFIGLMFIGFSLFVKTVNEMINRGF